MKAPQPPPPVRLDVRLEGGRAVGYALDGEFLVGAAAGCDLRLPAPNLPPVVCQFFRRGESVFVRRLAPIPLLINGQAIDDAPQELRNGDRLSIGPVEITAISAAPPLLHPKLVPTVEVKDDLDSRRALLDQQTRELEEDRRLWYARRQEMEAELARMREQVQSAPPSGDPNLAREWERLQSERDAFKNDLLRFDRRQGTLEAQESQLQARAAEIETCYAQMRHDAADLETELRAAAAEEEQLRGERERLERLRGDIDAQAAKFAERSALVESQQATLAVLRAKLDRQQEEVRRESDELALERRRQDDLRRELDDKLREAELVRAELGFLKDDQETRQTAVREQQSLLNTTLEEIRRQKEEIASGDARLKERESEVDTRAAEIAEQAATLKAQLTQALELQSRLEADRQAVREREIALAQSESARQTLAEQLRQRAEDLASRGQNVDGAGRDLAAQRMIIEQSRKSVDNWKANSEAELHELRRDLDERAAMLAEREQALKGQVERMREAGAAIAAERHALETTRKQQHDQRHQSQDFAARLAGQLADLRRQAPEVTQQAVAALEKLAGAREALRGQLAELHAYGEQSRQELQQRQQKLEAAEAEHRLAVATFRQQLLDWQAKVAEIRQLTSRKDDRVHDRQAELEAAEERVAAVQEELARRTGELNEELRIAVEKRNEMERHLADMREWYRAKLRDLAAGRAIDDSDMPAWDKAEGGGEKAEIISFPPSAFRPPPSEVDQADEHLAGLLRSRGFADETTLQALLAEARRQRKSLRQTLLASGVLTVFQLSMIEAGTLDGLALGRFRVVDRLKSGTHEAVYRVIDPSRPEPAILRVLSDDDAVRRDEFRDRFHAAAQIHHENLVNTLEVLEIDGRPAVLQEDVSGLPASDWPPLAATPGVWLRLLTEAVRGLAWAHAAGLVHGRLAADAFILSADGMLKVTGLGEPGWLAGPSAAIFEPLPAADLRSLGRAAYAWSQIGAKRRIGKGKAFPAEFSALVRRLEASAESAMGDIVSLEKPFADAAELLSELERLAVHHPCPPEAWAKLLQSIDRGEEPLRQSA